jgi:hypothetical protein
VDTGDLLRPVLHHVWILGGALINEVLDQKPFYDSPVKIASLLVGDAQRLAYCRI